MLNVLFVEIKNKTYYKLNKSMVNCWQNDHDSLYISSLCGTVLYM